MNNTGTFTDTTVIIPTINEEGNIGILLNDLKRKYPGIKLIVVDDGSTDNTKLVVEGINGCMFVDRSNESIHGLTISVMDGILLADTEYCIVMDADGQHPTYPIGAMIKSLQAGVDIVVGARNNTSGLSIPRRLISYGAIRLGIISLYLRGATVCNDVISGFFGVRCDLAKHQIHARSNTFVFEGYKVLFDLLKGMDHKTTKIEEIMYSMSTRKTGSSKMKVVHIYYNMRSLMG